MKTVSLKIKRDMPMLVSLRPTLLFPFQWSMERGHSFCTVTALLNPFPPVTPHLSHSPFIHSSFSNSPASERHSVSLWLFRCKGTQCLIALNSKYSFEALFDRVCLRTSSLHVWLLFWGFDCEMTKIRRTFPFSLLFSLV